MELLRQPQTELEYWATIESLGGFIWRMEHDLADGRIDDPDGVIVKDVSSAREISTRLVTELGEKFGVIAPRDCPQLAFGQVKPVSPEGKTYYWDWYEKMKAEAWRQEYDRIICSACPFSEGPEGMSASIPCSLWRGRGSLYQLNQPYECGMLGRRGFGWTDERLFFAVLNKGGAVALQAFQEKLTALKLAAAMPASSAEKK